jgi:23S rRNA (uridine2552-2'-O)-methyltransferase
MLSIATFNSYPSRILLLPLPSLVEPSYFIHLKDTVLDLGAAPGGWSQVAKEIVGESGTVIGVDLQKIEPIPGIVFIEGNVFSPEVINSINAKLGNRKVNVVISDMSPNISGNYSMDHSRSIGLCEKALEVSENLLISGGNFSVKVFQGDLYKDLVSKVSKRFRNCKGFKPRASRSESSELYIVGKGFIS